MPTVLRLTLLSALAVRLILGVPSPGLFKGSEAVDKLIDKAVADHRIPGAVLLVGHQGQVVYEKAYGKRALVPVEEAMTTDTIFDCASLTKVVATTAAVMKLYEAGKIRLDERVTTYIPEFQNGSSDITVRDLMTHYSGLRPDFDLLPAFSGYEAGIARAASDVPAGPRRSKFVYSDTNFILMGEMVRRLSGQPLDEFVRDQIFRPLGMADTMFLPIMFRPTMFRPAAGLLSRIAPTERLKEGEILRGVVHDPRARLMGGVAGHAGLFSTAEDLGRFCQMLLNKGVNPADATRPGRIFQAATVDLFTSPRNPPGTMALRGLGWDINSPFSGNRGDLFPIGSSYGHTGFTGTSIWIDPASQTYVVLLTNAVHPEVKKPITSLRRSVATAVALAVGYSKIVRTGLDVLSEEGFLPLLGKRVGLMTNQTGIDRKSNRNIDLMVKAGVRLTALFATEHGISGTEDREDVSGSVDSKTGIPVFSLYTQKTHRPTPEMLRNLDVLVFDIADVGARFYTYETAMAYAMEECARANKPFIVLDRPNPITGLHVEGPMLEAANESFVGYFPEPIRHGMTMGELARMFNAENKIGADLTVIPLTGWHRGDWFDSTALPWVNPSPNMPDLEAATLYPGLAMIEFAEDYSVGRGTNEPFHVAGARFVQGHELAEYLAKREIPGVRVDFARFSPKSSHLAGTEVNGARFSIVNRDIFDASRLGLEVAAALQTLYPGRISFRSSLSLIGSGGTVRRLESGDGAAAIRRDEEPALQKFRALRDQYLLYEQ